MIDIHSHVLAGIDDGARDTTESLLMLKQAVKSGTRAVVCTPHIFDTGCVTSPADISQRTDELRSMAVAEGIDIKLYTGAEIMLTHDLDQRYQKGEFTTLASSRYILIEPPMHDFPAYTETVMFNLMLLGLIPILAHPERNVTLGANPSRLYELILRGVMVQANAGSFTGVFGIGVRRFALRLIENNQVHFLGSDGHSTTGRTLVLAHGLKSAEAELRTNLSYLVNDNPKAVLADEVIVAPEPSQVDAKRSLLSRLFGR